MKDFSLALCQVEVTADKAENLSRARRQLLRAAQKGADIAVLPEMFNCPYDPAFFVKFAENRECCPTVAMLRQTAGETGLWIVGGSLPYSDDGLLYNACPVINPSGEIVAWHYKVHLFDVDLPGTRFQESSIFTPGNQVTVVTTPWARLGIGVCYDIRFPELARLMVDQGAEVLVYPAAFGPETGPAHWKLTLQARAVDNQVYCAGVSPAPCPGLSYQAWGHSTLVSPYGRVLAQFGSRPRLAVVRLLAEDLENLRRSLPLLRHRRPDIYRLERV